jgi:hypothetical protein
VDSLQSDAYPQVTTEVLSEVVRPDAANTAGWRAALQTLIFDCAKDQYRSISNLYFARGDRQGGFDQDSGDGVWHSPDPGATMDTVERAACFYGLRDRKAKAALASPGPLTAKHPPPKAAKTAHAKSLKAKPKISKPRTPVPAAAPAQATPQPEVRPQLKGFAPQ